VRGIPPRSGGLRPGENVLSCYRTGGSPHDRVLRASSLFEELCKWGPDATIFEQTRSLRRLHLRQLPSEDDLDGVGGLAPAGSTSLLTAHMDRFANPDPRQLSSTVNAHHPRHFVVLVSASGLKFSARSWRMEG
jgi:hypothetical protein